MTDLETRLTSTPLPDGVGAEERAWALVRSAHAEHPAVKPRTRRRWTAVAALAVVAALALVSATSAGHRAIESLRRTVGVERARPALFGLPTQGRLLLTTTTGAWVVSQNGTKRYLGNYTSATWSPHGLYVAVTKRNELRAVEPDGDVRWTISRPRISEPRWSPSGFRIAYHDRAGLRVVVADGTGDRLLSAGAASVAAAWQPGTRHLLAYSDTHGRVILIDTDTERVRRRTRPGPPVTKLAWSSDGRQLSIQRDSQIEIYRAERNWNAPWTGIRSTPTDTITDFAVRPGSHEVAVAFRNDQTGATKILCFTGSCRFDGSGTIVPLTWTADGQWLLLHWPQADQLVFIRDNRRPGVRAIANIAQQFAPHGTANPALVAPTRIVAAEWCCR